MTAIKNEWKVQRSVLLQELVMLFGAFLLGELIWTVLSVTVAKDEGWFPMGSVFLIIGLAIDLFCVGGQFTLGFGNAVTMSRTRKQFLLGHYIISMVCLTACALAALGLSQLEITVGTHLLGSEPMDLQFLYQPLYYVAFVVCGTVLANFLGALIFRFGRTAFWVLWAIWMFCSLVLPRMAKSAGESETLLTLIGQYFSKFFTELSLAGWSAVGLVGTLVAFFATLLLMRNQQVHA
ncbi:MAG: hypothetical protein PWQ08_899 [Clostridiales bacterium]|nr:hypothetical protein [Clostridiales bacterium]